MPPLVVGRTISSSPCLLSLSLSFHCSYWMHPTGFCIAHLVVGTQNAATEGERERVRRKQEFTHPPSPIILQRFSHKRPWQISAWGRGGGRGGKEGTQDFGFARGHKFLPPFSLAHIQTSAYSSRPPLPLPSPSARGLGMGHVVVLVVLVVSSLLIKDATNRPDLKKCS